MEKLSGFSPILVEAEPFEINGRTYQFRRLGVGDTFKIINIVKSAAVWGHNEATLAIRDFQVNKSVAWLIAPLLGIPEVEVLLMDFLELVLREVYRDADGKPDFRDIEIRDFTKFPMGSELIILSQLALHPDLGSFFTTFKTLKEHPAVANLLESLRKTSTDTGKTE